MSLPWPTLTTEEWEERLAEMAAMRAAGRADQPREPAGSPGGVGGQFASSNQPTGSDEPYGDARYPIEMFHGTTSAALEAIRRDGLIPAKGKGGDAWLIKNREILAAEIDERPVSVYMAEDERDAVAFARHATTMTGGHPIILTLNIPGRFVDDLKDDEQMIGGTRFEGKILPEWIKEARTLDEMSQQRNRNVFNRVLSGDKVLYLVIVADEK